MMKVNRMGLGVALIFILTALSPFVNAQNTFNPDTVSAGIYDMGKMWTFDYPPMEYFSKTYDFNADEKWFKGVQMSALRFGGGCSASFVSGDGLVMTNHHCARGWDISVQKSGENFIENGFFAAKATDERKVDRLFVDQLVMMEDITSRVQEAMEKVSDATEKINARNKVFEEIRKEYTSKENWKGLELQTITFYNGGKYSLYGFKRYRDVRLVFVPELQLGFYGGDYDNFTYPRYDLDCSFFRVYDENGQPLKTPDYFKFNLKGVTENEPVFVVGNPGTTARLSTMADLAFRRENQLPATLALLHGASGILQDVNSRLKKDSLLNIVFSLENSYKASSGELDGLYDPYLMARKSAFEKKFKTDVAADPQLSPQLTVWDEIEKDNKKLAEIFTEYFLLGPSPFLSGGLFSYAHSTVAQKQLSTSNPMRSGMMKKKIAAFNAPAIMEIEEKMLAMYLQTLQTSLGPKDPLVRYALGEKMPVDAAREILGKTRLVDAQFRSALMTDTTLLNTTDDPLVVMARMAVPRYLVRWEEYLLIQDRLAANRSKIGRMAFDLYGTRIPPDATFSLRINDGRVSGYEYNGTLAPYKTTFYGLYDRYYSFEGKKAWALPERWKNPPAELLPVGMNFVTTNDIIGGNSGSAMINRNKEVIGLVFDGNMESLPGRFIYVPEKNRAVGVNSAAIVAALKHIYKAKRLVNELSGIQ